MTDQLEEDHGHDCEGSQILVEQTLGEVQQQMADTTSLINQSADNANGHECERSPPIEEQHLKGEHYQKADTTETDNLCRFAWG